MLVIGVDVGGTGARAAIAREQGIFAQSELNGVTDKVTAVISLVDELIERAGVSEVDVVAVGAAGFQLTGARLRDGVPPKMPTKNVLLCSDMLTSYIGALGLSDGAVIAAGTGAVALGTDMAGTWQRVDGWGYLLGDHGGGSWIGRHAMHAALRAADGRPGGSRLLLRLLDKDPAELVAEISERPDRAGLMASFVPAVARAAEEGDVIAAGLLRTAGDHLADTALAALPLGARRTIATTGNLFKIGGLLWQRFTARLKHVELQEAKGTGLDGALTLAKAVITNELPENAPSLTLVKN
ncbi:MAG TPA: BadF/BadG/BcrA/BcrD ATPase family protein [Candidatus Limnocylindrales bacterium]|nr:BadF/BadG/BcrA/BcrD ATPase family protein [Candidatus Limnocylindrales bacterium]